MLLRDRLLARIAETAGPPDYVQLATDILGIRNAPPALARRLVEQALVVEDRRDVWLRMGERICAEAPSAPGVYLLRDAAGRALYVGKANNIRRRLRTHFAARRWRSLRPEFARAAQVEWREVGSEIEALLLEAQWIHLLAPTSNVQIGAPVLDTRAVPSTLLRDTVLVLPSTDVHAAELVAARVAGPVMTLRVQRTGAALHARATMLRRFFAGGAGVEGQERSLEGCAPLVFSWLAGRGAGATRLDPHDAGSARELERRLRVLLNDDRLFAERIVVLRSGFRPSSTRP